MRLNKRLTLILLLLVAIALPFIFRDAYFQQIMVLICIYSILALSFDVLVGYTGQVSMGHAALFGIGAYTTTLISMHFGISVWLSGLAGVILSGITGLILG